MRRLDRSVTRSSRGRRQGYRLARRSEGDIRAERRLQSELRAVFAEQAKCANVTVDGGKVRLPECDQMGGGQCRGATLRA